METYEAMCDPDEHCYHECELSTPKDAAVKATVCCDCGHTLFIPIASLAHEGDYPFWQ